MLYFVAFEMVSSLKTSAMGIQYWDVLGITCFGLSVYFSIYGVYTKFYTTRVSYVFKNYVQL